jgi:hypothetical protein
MQHVECKRKSDISLAIRATGSVLEFSAKFEGHPNNM